jgi:hypothetical protein
LKHFDFIKNTTSEKQAMKRKQILTDEESGPGPSKRLSSRDLAVNRMPRFGPKDFWEDSLWFLRSLMAKEEADRLFSLLGGMRELILEAAFCTNHHLPDSLKGQTLAKVVSRMILEVVDDSSVPEGLHALCHLIPELRVLFPCECDHVMEWETMDLGFSTVESTSLGSHSETRLGVFQVDTAILMEDLRDVMRSEAIRIVRGLDTSRIPVKTVAPFLVFRTWVVSGGKWEDCSLEETNGCKLDLGTYALEISASLQELKLDQEFFQHYYGLTEEDFIDMVSPQRKDLMGFMKTHSYQLMCRCLTDAILYPARSEECLTAAKNLCGTGWWHWSLENHWDVLLEHRALVSHFHGMMPMGVEDWRVSSHDLSKVSSEEMGAYVLKWQMTTGDKAFREALAHHYEVNDHHPEHWGKKSMGKQAFGESLLDLLAARARKVATQKEALSMGKEDLGKLMRALPSSFLTRYTNKDKRKARAILKDGVPLD